MHFRHFLLGTCYRCSRMFTSFCCRGPRSSTTTRTATSQHAVCYSCNPTTQHSPGVFMPLLLWFLVYYVNNWLHTEAYVLNSNWISRRCIYGVEPQFFIITITFVIVMIYEYCVCVYSRHATAVTSVELMTYICRKCSRFLWLHCIANAS